MKAVFADRVVRYIQGHRITYSVGDGRLELELELELELLLHAGCSCRKISAFSTTQRLVNLESLSGTEDSRFRGAESRLLDPALVDAAPMPSPR